MNVNVEAAIAWISTYFINILGALLIFVVGRWIARRIANMEFRILTKKEADETLALFLRNLTYYILLAVVVIAALGRLGVNTTSLVALLGTAGLAVGLALKDSLSNFAAGVMLILFRPFGIGGVVTAAGITAKVEKITIFNTVFATGDNQMVIVPNGKILGDTITNINARETRRIDLVVGIGYGDDVGRTKEILEGLAKDDSRVLADPAPAIAVSELANSSVNLVFRPWVKTEDYWDVRFDLTEKIKAALDEAGISIPYPQQDVHLLVEKGPAEAAAAS
jgi:small conductance mechanosensitive channel